MVLIDMGIQADFLCEKHSSGSDNLLSGRERTGEHSISLFTVWEHDGKTAPARPCQAFATGHSWRHFDLGKRSDTKVRGFAGRPNYTQ
jgi:hypothetical protein